MQENVVVDDSTLWSRLDAIILQWIYGTISNNLLHTILQPNSTAQNGWERLQNIFQDNKHSRVASTANNANTTLLKTNHSTIDTYNVDRLQNPNPYPSSNRGNNGPKCGQNCGCGHTRGG